MGSPHAEAGPRRLPLLPALDGIRAVAVLAVLLYHADLLWVPGGFLGVEVFFVLSGYLITSLLWTELRDTGRVSLRRFWARRARRLLPALFAMLAVVVFAFLAGWPGEVARIRGDVVAALTYFSNWYLIGTDSSYFASLGRPSPFAHLWSLAIEEQFYLIWPAVLGLLAVGIRKSRRVAAVIIRAAAVSTVAMFVLYDPASPTRAYLGTDTRAAGLLIGAALAVLWRPWEARERRFTLTARALDGIAVLSGAVLVWAFLRFDEMTAFTFRPGMQIVAIATAALIAATVHPRARLGRALGWAPLRALGRRSYSIYLWHWPVFVVTRPGIDLDLPFGVVLAVRLAITFALAELSFRYVEEPIRRGAIGRLLDRAATRALHSPASFRRVVLESGTAAVAIVTAIAAFGTLLARAPEAGPSEIERSLVGVVRPEPRAVPVAVAARRELPPRQEPSARVVHTAIARPSAPSLVEPIRRLSSLKPGVVLIGDSVMLGARDVLPRRIGEVRVHAAVSRQVSEGLSILRRMRAEGKLREALVIHLGNNGTFTREQFDELAALTVGIPKVVLVSVKVPRRWERSVNDVIRKGVQRHPGMTVLDWHQTWRACPGDVFYDDGIHLTPAGAKCYAAQIAAVV